MKQSGYKTLDMKYESLKRCRKDIRVKLNLKQLWKKQKDEGIRHTDVEVCFTETCFPLTWPQKSSQSDDTGSLHGCISMSIKPQRAEKVSMGIQMQRHWTSVSYKESCSFLSLNKAACKQRQQASHQLSRYNITKWKTDLVFRSFIKLLKHLEAGHELTLIIKRTYVWILSIFNLKYIINPPVWDK